MTDSYEVYSPDATTDPGASGAAARVDASGPWYVAVEFSNQGQAKPPTRIEITTQQYADRSAALERAQHYAFEFDPPDPFSPQGRRVFRDGPDGFLVIIEGAMTTFHMSVRVIQHVGDA